MVGVLKNTSSMFNSLLSHTYGTFQIDCIVELEQPSTRPSNTLLLYLFNSLKLERARQNFDGKKFTNKLTGFKSQMVSVKFDVLVPERHANNTEFAEFGARVGLKELK